MRNCWPPSVLNRCTVRPLQAPRIVLGPSLRHRLKPDSEDSIRFRLAKLATPVERGMENRDRTRIERRGVVIHQEGIAGTFLHFEFPAAVLPQTVVRKCLKAVVNSQLNLSHKEVQHLRVPLVESVKCPQLAVFLGACYQLSNCVFHVASLENKAAAISPSNGPVSPAFSITARRTPL